MRKDIKYTKVEEQKVLKEFNVIGRLKLKKAKLKLCDYTHYLIGLWEIKQ